MLSIRKGFVLYCALLVAVWLEAVVMMVIAILVTSLTNCWEQNVENNQLHFKTRQ